MYYATGQHKTCSGSHSSNMDVHRSQVYCNLYSLYIHTYIHTYKGVVIEWTSRWAVYIIYIIYTQRVEGVLCLYMYMCI